MQQISSLQAEATAKMSNSSLPAVEQLMLTAERIIVVTLRGLWHSLLRAVDKSLPLFKDMKGWR